MLRRKVTVISNSTPQMKIELGQCIGYKEHRLEKNMKLQTFAQGMKMVLGSNLKHGCRDTLMSVSCMTEDFVKCLDYVLSLHPPAPGFSFLWVFMRLPSSTF